MINNVFQDAEVIVDWRPLDDALDSSSILYAGKVFKEEMYY